MSDRQEAQKHRTEDLVAEPDDWQLAEQIVKDEDVATTVPTLDAVAQVVEEGVLVTFLIPWGQVLDAKE
jgi:hypothetical protein